MLPDKLRKFHLAFHRSIKKLDTEPNENKARMINPYVLLGDALETFRENVSMKDEAMEFFIYCQVMMKYFHPSCTPKACMWWLENRIGEVEAQIFKLTSIARIRKSSQGKFNV